MNVLIDTNIALDILLNRQPYYKEAAIIFGLSEKKLIKSYISASAITDIFYLTQKEHNKSVALDSLKKLLRVFNPATVTGTNIYQALELNWNDFEDSLQYIVGESLPADYIITRNPKDFLAGTIEIVTPPQFIDLLTGPPAD
jgi:predicted nucleic acid-binding protein